MNTSLPHNHPPDSETSTAILWHLTLNHAPLETLKQRDKHKLFHGLTTATLKSLHTITCTACAARKSQPARHHPNPAHSTTPRYSISSDTTGPLNPRSTQTHAHTINFIYTAPRFAISIPSTSKGEVSQVVPATLSLMAQTQQRHPRTLRTDN